MAVDEEGAGVEQPEGPCHTSSGDSRDNGVVGVGAESTRGLGWEMLQQHDGST